MSHQEPSRRRQTIRIKIPPKPAAPRHVRVVARAIPMPNVAGHSHGKHNLFLFPIVQVTIASLLAVMTLDDGECSQIVVYAALGYVGGLLMMVPRREALTLVDEFLIRWGFVMLCVISCFVSQLIWALRGYLL